MVDCIHYHFIKSGFAIGFHGASRVFGDLSSPKPYDKHEENCGMPVWLPNFHAPIQGEMQRSR